MKRIESLKPNQIFVFGSNANGSHAGGAARQALESFGAIMGQAEGLQGQSYGIVTLDKDMQKVSLDYIKEQLVKLNDFAKKNDDKIFLLTLIGCGIAGFSIEEIKSVVTEIEWARNIDIPEEFRVIQSYKAFDKDMKCKGYQYGVGGEYEEESASACKSGFHACTNPFDVLSYYPLIDEDGHMTRFASVEQSGMVDNKESDKTCSSRIKIKAELGLPGFVKACVEWVKEITSPAKIKNSGDLSDNSGHSAQIGSSGDYAKIGSSGDSAQIGSSGDSAKIGSSGHSAKIGSSGDSAKIGSSGDSAQIGSSGDSAQIGSSGHSAKIGSSGDSAKIDSTGEDSVICCAGHGSVVKAKIGSWITLAEWKYDNNKSRYVPVCVKTEYVDGERIKADIWYKLIDGEFVEV